MAVAANLKTYIPDQYKYEKQACRLLEKKYHQEFQIFQYEGKEWTANYYKVIAYSEEYPDILFEAQIKDDGSEIYDEYICARVCRKIETQMEEYLEGLQGYIQLKVLPLVKGIDSTDADMSIEEFMDADKKNRFAVYLCYCPQIKNIKNVYKSLYNVFQQLDYMSGNIQLYVTDEKTLKEVQNYFDENAKIYYEYEAILEDADHIVIPFEQGTIQLSEQEFERRVGEIL